MGLCISICNEDEFKEIDNTENSIEDFRTYIRNKNKLHVSPEKSKKVIGRFKK